MLSSEVDNILSKEIKFKNKFSNKEILLCQYFREKTKVFPVNIILVNDYIFFFVNNEDYFKAKIHQNSLRQASDSKKIIIIRLENNLIKQIFSFFPDTYIHDISVERNSFKKDHLIIICFLSYKERGIAIGGRGEYIKTVNYILKNHIILENHEYKNEWPLKIQCIVVPL